MTTANPFFDTIPHNKEDRVEWARLAAIRANEQRWRWQAYAQMMTRNSKIKIAFTSETPRTDGSTIWLRVPIELGNPAPHNKKVCGERDANLILKCQACAVLEDVQITMYHEVAHIAFDTFAEMTDDDKINLLRDAFRLEANGVPGSKRLGKIAKTIERYRPTTFVAATKMISPWFGTLLNVTEDGRVNKRMMDSRPGTKKMFAAQTTIIFEHGVTDPAGNVMKWIDMPVNNQALIILYCKIFGLDYTGWFDEKVIADLDDMDLNLLVQRVGTARSVSSVYRLCIPILERMRELGYCRTPDDEEDDPEPEPEPQPKGKPEKGEPQEEGSGAGSGGSSDDSDDEDEESASGGDDESDDGDQGDQQEGSGGSAGETSTKDDNAGTDDPSEDGSGSDTADEDTAETDDSGSGDGDADEDTDAGAGDDEEEEFDSSDSDGTVAEYKEGDEDDDKPVECRAVAYTKEQAEQDGLPEDAEEAFGQFGRHDGEGHVGEPDSRDDTAEVERALVQVEFFDAPSVNIHGVSERRGLDGPAWESHYGPRNQKDIKVPEHILSPALMRLRVAFAENKRGSHQRDLRSGRVNGAILGRRVPTGDDRLFERKIKPGKRDWFVEIGIDVSGSTSSGAITLLKASAFAQAELCQRVGVRFAVYAHTGEYVSHAGGHGMDLAIYVIKAPEDRWDNQAKERLNKLGPSSANLDGHTLEYYRKVAERQRTTDKLIMYYTDGEMPMENYKEELEILQREIVTCRRSNIHIVGIGVGTDAPRKHGLDTIRIDRIEDVPKVVQELEKRLAVK